MESGEEADSPGKHGGKPDLPSEESALRHLILLVVSCAVIVDQAEHVLVEELLCDEDLWASKVGGLLSAARDRVVTGGAVSAHFRVLDGPGKRAVERVEEHSQGPRDDHVVVDHHEEAGDASCETETVEAGVEHSPHLNVTALKNLTDTKFKAEHWDTQKEEADQVGDEETGTTVFETEVGETP